MEEKGRGGMKMSGNTCVHGESIIIYRDYHPYYIDCAFLRQVICPL